MIVDNYRGTATDYAMRLANHFAEKDNGSARYRVEVQDQPLGDARVHHIEVARVLVDGRLLGRTAAQIKQDVGYRGERGRISVKSGLMTDAEIVAFSEKINRRLKQ